MFTGLAPAPAVLAHRDVPVCWASCMLRALEPCPTRTQPSQKAQPCPALRCKLLPRPCCGRWSWSAPWRAARSRRCHPRARPGGWTSRRCGREGRGRMPGKVGDGGGGRVGGMAQSETSKPRGGLGAGRSSVHVCTLRVHRLPIAGPPCSVPLPLWEQLSCSLACHPAWRTAPGPRKKICSSPDLRVGVELAGGDIPAAAQYQGCVHRSTWVPAAAACSAPAGGATAGHKGLAPSAGAPAPYFQPAGWGPCCTHPTMPTPSAITLIRGYTSVRLRPRQSSAPGEGMLEGTGRGQRHAGLRGRAACGRIQRAASLAQPSPLEPAEATAGSHGRRHWRGWGVWWRGLGVAAAAVLLQPAIKGAH